MISSNKLKHEFLNIHIHIIGKIFLCNQHSKKFYHLLKIMALAKILRRGKTFGGRPRGGVRAEPTGRGGIFENFQKIS